jgi:predicted DNA-binding transcriptional regulator AlpA
MSPKARSSKNKDLFEHLGLPQDIATASKQQAKLSTPPVVLEAAAVQKKFPPPAAKPDHPQDTDAGECFLSDLDVAKRYGVSRPTVWRWRKTNPDFPDPVLISPGTTRWKLSDLLAFEARLPVKSGHDRAKPAVPGKSGGER